ncbi:hypothetical protein LMG31506_00187 [Cupriavidus yeoncheonensis]|uniref:Uncharacterized protein n=1 Tax=Cupriavidus yeoncheonensis TaxID=1462994 RepID=A0A916IP72_9BURK|nr:hypothetical protein [Cupriavidus yeoncheonensis]CAG2126817.1 hypothetical protein LMG31506_00187 [Cupriavidus yeoncheonensis]
MGIESYKDYTVRGFAKQLADGSFEAFGTVQKDHLVLEASEPLGSFATFEFAVAAGIAWAKAWIEDQR